MQVKKYIKNLFRPIFYRLMHPRIKKLCGMTMLEMKKYKNAFEGKRCFILGNGPSLRISDLELLKDEITFACNRIYVLFDKTDWKPTFYLCQDPTVLRGCIDEIRELNSEIIKIIKPTGQRKYDVENAIYFDNNYDYSFKRRVPPFSENPEKTIFDGLSVTYTAIQFAVYMGFKEIYLLGVDSNYSLQNNHINVKSYSDPRMYDEKKVGMPPDMQYTFKAYEVAKQYTEEHKIKVYNATRGGSLEVFDRIDFDSLMEL